MAERATPARVANAAKRRQSDKRAGKAGLLAKSDADTLSEALSPVATAVAEVVEAPTVLLAYQQAWIADDSTLKVAEKGRRVGLTWAEAADDVLIAAAMSGSNVFYISATEDMAREYIEACAMWALHFNQAASEIAEGIYDDSDDAAKDKRYIKTYEVSFPGSGKRIVALSSRPTNLRGKQGVIVIDEAAYAPDLAALLKAAMAMLMWGDKVRIISTHDGADNPFNELIQDIRAGKRGKDASVHTITFDQAVADGLYCRVCLRKGKVWTQEGQDEWVHMVRTMYADNAAEELDAIPSQSGGAYLPLALISERMAAVGAPSVIVRQRFDDALMLMPQAAREWMVKGWIAEKIEPLLKTLNPAQRHRFGWDFARVADLSVLWVTAEEANLQRKVAMQIELSNCPFGAQEQILWYVIDHLPRFAGGAMDAGGNGAQVAENTMLRYGAGLIHCIKLSQPFYIEHMPKLKAALQDAVLVDVPRDEDTQSDLRAIRVIKGVPKLPDVATQKAVEGVRLRRHGDVAIAAMLECYIAAAEVSAIGWQSVSDVYAPADDEKLRMTRPKNRDSQVFRPMDGW